jgi:hypothetical protein
MELRGEILAFMALGRYFKLKKAKVQNAYRIAVEEVRIENCPTYDKDGFLGDITNIKNRIKKDGTMREIFNRVNANESYEKISLYLESKYNDIESKLIGEQIASENLASIGGRDCANEDVLSTFELKILGIL